MTASAKNGKKNKTIYVYRLPWKGLFSPIFLQSGVNENNLALSLLECLIEFCKMVLTFESVDEIL